MARTLSRKFRSIETLKSSSLNELESTPEIGPKIAESLYTTLKDKSMITLIEKLKTAGLQTQLSDDTTYSNKGNLLIFNGKNVVLTGSLEKIERSKAKTFIEQLGGNVRSSVSTKTDLVVFGQKPGSKLKKAGELKIDTCDETQFLTILTEAGLEL